MRRKRDPHVNPITRRELLSQGILSVGGFAVVPSMLGLFSRRAIGAELVCSPAADGTVRMMPFIVFDLTGGGNIGGTNVVVGDLGGQKSFLPDTAYSLLGLPPESVPGKAGVNEELGLAFHPLSPMLAGIKQFALPATMASTDGAVFCASSADDRPSNPFNPLYWIAKSGLNGDLVSLIDSPDPQGDHAKSISPAKSVDPAKTPSRIARSVDATGLVTPGKLTQIMQAVGTTSDADVKKVMAAIRSMSESRLKMFQEKDVSAQIQDLIKCGYINSENYFSGFSVDALDAANDTTVTQNLFNFANGVEQTAGTIAKLVLDGMAGGGTVALGGYDYHGNTRADQVQRDTLAGQMIGKTLELAARKQKPVMIYVYTDGGVSSAGGAVTNGFYKFNSDAGQCGATFALVYKPGAKRGDANRDENRQIGAFQNGGIVDVAASPVGANVEALTMAVVANYLALHGRENELPTVVKADPFGADLKKHLAFKKII